MFCSGLKDIDYDCSTDYDLNYNLRLHREEVRGGWDDP